jgi:AcrR family transcriptional regulator
VADEAGYTKGAVYSNFASKEDVFFAVHERRVERYVPQAERALAQTADLKEAIVSLAAEHSARRERERDGWLAVFLEFWTHVLRHPEHRERFDESTRATSSRSRPASSASPRPRASSCRSTRAG